MRPDVGLHVEAVGAAEVGGQLERVGQDRLGGGAEGAAEAAGARLPRGHGLMAGIGGLENTN